MESTLTVPLFLSLIAIIISTISALVRLISDTDSRISDFRKEWNESLRKGVATFNSKILGIFGRIAIESIGNESIPNSRKDKLKEDLFPLWESLREAESLVTLHNNNI